MRKLKWGRVGVLLIVVIVIYFLIVLGVKNMPEFEKEEVKSISGEPQLIFYYSSSTDSADMALAVNKLKNEFNFEQIDAFAEDVDFSGVIPSFYCIEKNETLEGAISQNELKDFAEGCVE